MTGKCMMMKGFFSCGIKRMAATAFCCWLAATLAHCQSYSFIKNFAGAPNDGDYPAAGLVLIGGTLYGTTEIGGSLGYGTIFRVNTNGTGYGVVKSFSGSDGAYPAAGLILSGNTLFGTTTNNDSDVGGRVFRVNTTGAGLTAVKDFSVEHLYPRSGVVLNGSTLYGVAVPKTPHYTTGSEVLGVVFKVNTNGTGYTVLKGFAPVQFRYDEGSYPHGGLVLSGSTLYGTTASGGLGRGGTVFKVDTNGNGFMVLKSFSGNDGSSPEAGLLLNGSSLYGTTESGGDHG